MKYARIRIILSTLIVIWLIQQPVFGQNQAPYTVLNSGGDDGNSANYGLVGSLSQPVIGIMNGATNGSQAGFWHQERTVIPPIPQDLSAIAGNSHVNLSWRQNPYPDVNRYYIYRDTSSPAMALIDSVVAVSLPDTFYVDNNVTNSITYFYRITAMDSFGNESDFSDEANAIPYGSSSFDWIMSVGWNMIGLPLDVNDSYYLSIFSAPPMITGTLYEFTGSYSATDTLDTETGYWLRFTEPDTVEIVGLPVDSICIDVLEGWNMIAGPSCDVHLANVQDPGDIIIDSTLYRFTGLYQPAIAIEQGEGYWIRVTADGQLCMSCSQATVASYELASSIDLLENAARLIISDGKGGEQTLYFNSNLSGLSYSLPPVPPPGSFDIRFSGDTRLTTADETAIRIQGIDYPLTIKADNLPEEYGFGYIVKEMIGDQEIATHSLVNGAEIAIVNADITHLLLSRTTLIPINFAVWQNYPNPFNPITTVRYALPRTGPVEIRIYNIAGQRVKTLVDEKQEPGYYSVSWDGRNEQGSQVNSGTYFYRVKAGKEDVMKKMVLLK